MIASVRWWWVRHAPIETGGRYPLPEAMPDMAAASPALDALAAALPRDAVWLASPLARARATARALIERVDRRGVAPVTLDGLAEPDFGAWAGSAYDAVYAETGAEAWRHPAALRPPGRERLDGRVQRAASAGGNRGSNVQRSACVDFESIEIARIAERPRKRE